MSNLNQQPSVLLLPETISDPNVRNNFDILNKQIQKIRQIQQPPASNIVFGNTVYDSTTGKPKLLGDAFTSLTTPGFLQAQITTKGNPVSMKISFAPYNIPFDGSTVYASIYGIQKNSNTNAIAQICGWLRNNVQICQMYIKNVLVNPGGTDTGFINFIPLPAFEFEDVVAAGTYTYQFYYQNVSPTAVIYQNIRVVLKELR